MEFPGGAVDKDPPANRGHTGSIPDLGRCPTHHNDWTHALEPASHSTEKRSHRNGKPQELQLEESQSKAVKTQCNQKKLF